MLNLDTHILIHALQGKITPSEKKLLTGAQWSISAIVLWELSKLRAIGRVTLKCSEAELKAALAAVHIWPLTFEICELSTKLDFSGDPADELIAATSIAHKIPLITRDRVIRGSKMVEVV